MSKSRSIKQRKPAAVKPRAPSPWDNTWFFLWGSRVHDLMKNSTTYQEIYEEGVMEGKAEVIRKDILRIGTTRFGMPSRKIRETISQISDLDRLKSLLVRSLDVSTWNELFGE